MEMVTKILSGLPTLHVGFRLCFPKDVETNKIKASRDPPGVNFINVLRAPFSYKSILGSFSLVTVKFETFRRKITGAKAAHKMLMKLTTGVNLINISRAAFFTKVFCTAFLQL
jgi:hypothetical protein